MWVKAEGGDNSFVPIRLKWNLHPERNQKWRDEQDTILGHKLAAQECLSGESKVTVRNEKTGIIETLTLKELYDRI
jgi:hypothetical protein